MDYRADTSFLVDSTFLGITEGDNRDNLRQRLKSIVDNNPELKNILHLLKGRNDEIDNPTYRDDSMSDSILSPELEAMLDQLENKPSSRKDSASKIRKDSKPVDNGLSPELNSMLDSLESGKQKTRFDAYSQNWVELGFPSQQAAELAYYQELDEQERRDASNRITDKRKRRNIDGSLSPVKTRDDASEEHLSPSERISKKRVARGKQKVNQGATYDSFFNSDGTRK